MGLDSYFGVVGEFLVIMTFGVLLGFCPWLVLALEAWCEFGPQVLGETSLTKGPRRGFWALEPGRKKPYKKLIRSH